MSDTTTSAAIVTTPPRLEHRQYNDDLDEWSDRGVENPHEVDWATVFYTCRFCPGEGDEPDAVDHAPSCPTVEHGGEPGGD